MVTEDYRLEYNHRRPHSSLDYETPAVYAAKVGGPPASATHVGTGSAALRLPQHAMDEQEKRLPTLMTTGT